MNLEHEIERFRNGLNPKINYIEDEIDVPDEENIFAKSTFTKLKEFIALNL